MSDEFATFNLDRPTPTDFKSSEQMRRHSVDKSLENKPIERALHILMVGEEIQKLSVLQSIPNLLVEDTKGCIQKIFPKVNQGLLQASTEYHLAASVAIRSIVEQKLIPPDLIVHHFLHGILNCVESRDPEVSRAWFETLLDVITILPISIIHREILPSAVAKSEISKPILHRLMSCKLLGRIAKGCDIYVMKKDVFPIIQALTQDTSKEVRAAICMELPACAAILTATADKDILPILNEFANDEESLVKVAACQTMVDILPYSSQDVLKTMIIPLSKKMITLALFPGEDEMKVIVTKNFGKIALGFEKVITQNDKMWMLEHFCKLAQLGLPHMKFKERVVQKHIPRRNSFTSNMLLQCRLNCAFNIPGMLLFASDLDNTCITNTIYPVICDLASDPYFMVRRTVGAGLHEVTRILGHDNSLVIMEFIKLLKDDTEEVLQGIVPNLKSTMESFCETKTLTPEFVDETAIELARALLKCEAEIASTYNWRLHSKFIEQLEVLPKCLPSDFIYSQFVPVVYKRLFSCRVLPCRLAMVRTLLKFLRYNLKPSQRSELRNKLINELCCSSSFYDRIIFVKSCPDIMDIFSSAYFREFFFVKTLQLLEDKVPNVRLLAYTLLPQLKTIAKGAEKSTPRFTQMVENAMRVSGTETDRDVMESINITVSKLEKMPSFKPDPRDVQKLEEEKLLASMTSGKEWKPHLSNSAPTGPIGSHMSAVGRHTSSNTLTEKRTADFSRGPLSSSVSRMDSLRGSSPQQSGRESRFRTVAGSPGLAIRSPEHSSQSLTSTKSPNSERSGIDHATSRSLMLPSDEDGGAVDNSNRCVDVNDNYINSDSSKVQGRTAASSGIGTSIPKNINRNSSTFAVVDKSNKIPVRRYRSKDFNNSHLSKPRRPSSVCGSEVLRPHGKGGSDRTESQELLNNNNMCDSRRSNTQRRPHSMTSLLPPTTSCRSSLVTPSRTTVTASVEIGNKINAGSSSDHSTPNPLASRLPIRTSSLRSPTSKRS